MTNNHNTLEPMGFQERAGTLRLGKVTELKESFRKRVAFEMSLDKQMTVFTLSVLPAIHAAHYHARAKENCVKL